MNSVRRAVKEDIPRLLELLVHVDMVHHNGRPDLFNGPATKYSAEELEEIFTGEGCTSVEADPEVPKALELALKAKGEDGLLFCVGSLYLVGEIKAAIARRKE